MLANEIGDYEGSTAEYLDGGVYALAINADGDWTIDFEQINFDQSSRESSFSGTGDLVTSVFEIDGGLTMFHLTHEGSSNFAVKILGSNDKWGTLLANEIGNYEGTTAEQLPTGHYVFSVLGDGDWTIEIE